MGGLVVKQMLYQAKADNKDDFINNTIGVVCREILILHLYYYFLLNYCFPVVSGVL